MLLVLVLVRMFKKRWKTLRLAMAATTQ